MKLALLFAALAGLAPGILDAQVAGRWRLSLDLLPGSSVSGELVLTEEPGGRLLLENRDSAWMPLREVRFAGDSVAFTVLAGSRLRFEGSRAGSALSGILAAEGGRRVPWRAVRLDPEEEFYAAVPRFVQRQMTIGADPPLVVPGQWLAASHAMGERPESATTRYTEVALRSGLAPLPPDSVQGLALFRAMGLFDREGLHRAALGTLENMRRSLANDTSVARFDNLFRPGGRWQVDIHDVALARARRPFPTLHWASAEPALAAAGLIERRAGVDALPLALYRLAVQAQNDTLAWRTTIATIRQADASSAAAVLALVSGYGEASEWYGQAMQFLLTADWIPAGGRTRSAADLVREAWGSSAPVPDIRARSFGYPEGAVRIGTDSLLAARILQPENASARDWIARHGYRRLLQAIHRLRVPAGEATRLAAGKASYRLSSVEWYAGESFSGFLEPRDLILLDPSYSPLLALGTLVHEWQHILQGRARQVLGPGGGFAQDGEQVRIQVPDPFLAEGLAEWMTETILAPAVAEYPLLAFGETEKRISLPQNDPHNLGYLLVRTLARTLNDVEATRRLLVEATGDARVVVLDPRIRRAWSRFRGPDRPVARHGDPVLLPEAIFTIEDGEPDLVQSRIIAPYISAP